MMLMEKPLSRNEGRKETKNALLADVANRA
jgi:hypothetical protein